MQWRRPPHPARPPLHTTLQSSGATALVRRWTLVVSLGASASMPAVLDAQWRVEAGAGAARVTQPENPERMASTVDASVAWLGTRAAVVASGAVTTPSRDDQRVHGDLAASLRTDRWHALALELTGSVSAYDERRFPRMLSGFAGLRLHARVHGLDAWGGFAAGTLDDATVTYPHSLWEAGVTGAWRTLRLGASVTRNATLGEPRIEFVGDPPLQVTVRDGLRYVDAVVTAHARPARLELDGRIGARRVQRTIAYEELPPDRVFGDVSAAWRFTPRVAVAASFGHVLADLARGLPEARYATVGLRVRLHDSHPAAPRATRRPAVAGTAPDVLVERGGAAGATLRVLASPSSRVIEVAGTFTEWEPLPLRATGDGAWTLDVPVQAGRHRIMVRVDGGEWMAPANLPAVDDEVGGRVGLFTIADAP